MAREPNETGRLGPGKRLGLALAGVVLGLLVLEFGLRLGGLFLLNAEARRNHRPLSTEAPLVVLCLGESTTFMGGKVSYPRQLEGELASQLGAGTVRVINEGIPATTTDEIAFRIAGLVDRYDPDFVVTMMGINDRERFGDSVPSGGVLEGLQVVKLFRLLGRHLQDRARGVGGGEPPPLPGSVVRAELALARTAAAEGRPAEARDRALAVLDQDPFDVEAYLVASLAEAALRGTSAESVLADAESEYVKRLEADPASAQVRGELARILALQDRGPEASDLLLNAPAIEDVPAFPRVLTAWALHKLAAAHLRDDDPDSAREYALDALAILPADPPVSRARAWQQLAAIETAAGNAAEAARAQSEARRWMQPGFPVRTRLNYERVAQLLAGRRIEHIAVQYPMRPLESLAEMLEGIPGITMIENRRNFEAAVAEHGYWAVFNDRFAGDFGHMTEAGNALLAQSVARAIVGRLPDPPS